MSFSWKFSLSSSTAFWDDRGWQKKHRQVVAKRASYWQESRNQIECEAGSKEERNKANDHQKNHRTKDYGS